MVEISRAKHELGRVGVGHLRFKGLHEMNGQR